MRLIASLKKGCASENQFSRIRTLSPGLASSRLHQLPDLIYDQFRPGHEGKMAAVRKLGEADVRNALTQRGQATRRHEHIAVARENQCRRFDMTQLPLDI